MQELYQLIEQKIKNAGCLGEIDGQEFYDEFDLHYVDIHVGEMVYHVDFDAE